MPTNIPRGSLLDDLTAEGLDSIVDKTALRNFVERIYVSGYNRGYELGSLTTPITPEKKLTTKEFADLVEPGITKLRLSPKKRWFAIAILGHITSKLRESDIIED